MMKIKIFFRGILCGEELREGQKIPKWFGFSYYKPAMDVLVYYRIPLNLIVRYLRKIILFLIFPNRPFHCDHYNKGFRDGMNVTIDKALEEMMDKAKLNYETIYKDYNGSN